MISLQRRTFACSPPLKTRTRLSICFVVKPHFARAERTSYWLKDGNSSQISSIQVFLFSYGVVTSVDHPGAQDIYTVKAPNGKEYMFPGVDAFLKERNPPEGYLLVTPIPGLLDDDFDSEREEE